MGRREYDAFLGAAAERFAASGVLDLVDLTTALEMGIHHSAFQLDVERAAFRMEK